MFKLQFSTDNAAFEDDAKDLETVTILREIADKIERGTMAGRVRDSNGNTIGEFKFT